MNSTMRSASGTGRGRRARFHSEPDRTGEDTGCGSARLGPIVTTEPAVPAHLLARIRAISDAGIHAVRTSLKDLYFAFPRRPMNYLATEWGQQDLQNHLFDRLRRDREEVVPWLDDGRTICGSKVLEIGCGTGCSTVALAEQGAEVVAIDIDEPSLGVARQRCEVYDLDVDFRLANAADIGEIFGDVHFDFIIFYATLEHMIHTERILALRSAWDLLPKGGLLCVVETPNRLWHTDQHTALLPFFHWLPDDLAFEYSRFSSRPHFSDLYDDYGDERQRLHFLRRGRGASFHEFAVAIAPVEQLNVHSSLAMHLAGRRGQPSVPPLDDRYQRLLMEIYPSIHSGFFERNLDLILLKTD
jgi:2-polyprenyl-3-methyl-5-hydroxy-6-metoxy-1,4-benzoquinol methylase